MSETAEFWRGDFGVSYTARCDSQALISANEEFFHRAFFEGRNRIQTMIEFGANRGLNLRAIHEIDDELKMAAVEVNAVACEELRRLGYVDVHEQSLLEGDPAWGQHDLALVKGVLIHLSPDELPRAYDVLYRSSKRYILMAEYYAKTPTPVSYRGHEGKLWRRDFAGEFLDRFNDVKLADYGFVYDRDPIAPQDNINWFLLEKSV